MLELVVVILIISIAAGVGIPNLMAYNTSARLKGAARTVAGDLMGARMTAIKRNCNVIVEFKNETRYALIVDLNRNRKSDDGERQIIRDLNKEFPGVTAAADDTKNVFNAKGAMSRMRIITLENASGIKRIRISIAGRIKIE